MSNVFVYDSSTWSSAGGGSINASWPATFYVTKVSNGIYHVSYCVYIVTASGTSDSAFYDYGIDVPGMINTAIGTLYNTSNSYTLVQSGFWGGIIDGEYATAGANSSAILGLSPYHALKKHRLYWGRIYNESGSEGNWPFSKWSAGDQISGWFMVKVS